MNIKRTFASAIAAMSVSIAAFAGAPSFPGGETAMNEYISANTQYPATAKENGIEGIVNLVVTIKADGSIGTIKIVRMIDPDLEAEAIRVVKGMPAWNPGTNANGKAIDSSTKIDVPFILE
jgi:TonB family protein